MSTVNASTGYAPFQLHLGRQPRLIPPVSDAALADTRTALGAADADKAAAWIAHQQTLVNDARDSLMAAKVTQAVQANKHRSPEHVGITDGSQVMLSTYNRRRDYKSSGEDRAAK
ncbi:hypothetical protein PENSPDRAFT_544795, partial [Peniophora sp. CONT]